MNNRYRIMNASGAILCHKDTIQQAADVVCNLGSYLCRTQYVEDLRPTQAFPFFTYQYDGVAFIGGMHGTRESAIACLTKPNMKPFEFEHWHAWQGNGVAQIILSDESIKQLYYFDTTDDCINWLFLNEHKAAARALNKHVKGV